jgi:3-deoxy-D-manno-octulosonic-acid transferase
VLLLYNSAIRIAAFAGNAKAKLWIDGRKNWREKLKTQLKGKSANRIWVHCASLGEFEQGRPLIEHLKNNSKDISIILSFFSPSGFEVRKNYAGADVVCYLPLDSSTNAEDFIDIVTPSAIFFIKYEYWYHYFEISGRKNISLYIVSAIFRPDQIFFKSYGKFFRKALKNVRHFFVQDQNSKLLLDSIGFANVSVTGDTRFDRVHDVVTSRKSIELIEKFKGDRKLVIGGSTWKKDEEIFIGLLRKSSIENTCIVIAPHEVNENRTKEIEEIINRNFPSAGITRFSSGTCKGTETFFILDTIGLLSSAYYYSSIAWIGGGFGNGIHNILEAAAFGNPVLFGPNFEKFKEARDLIDLRAAFSLKSMDEKETLERLLNDQEFYFKASKASADYVLTNTGATASILKLIQHS